MKTMKKNIVLKLLTGVVTTTITATGIAVPMIVGSEQNREDISVTVDEDIQVAETVVDTEIIGDETNIVEDEAVAEDEAIVEDDAEAEEDKSTDIKSARTESTKIKFAQSTPMPEQSAQLTPTPGQSAQLTPAPGQLVQSTPAPGQSAQSTPVPGRPVQSTPTPEQAAQSTSTPEQPVQFTFTPEQAEQSTSTPEQAAQFTSTPEQPVQPTPEPVHEHNWIARTNQRWVSQIVTVVDEPERYEEYGIFKIYWYNTGTWEETRDPDRFTEWAHSEYGSLYPFYHIDKNEDNPLFLGYNELGQPSFTGDHVLWTGYDFIPAVTHEEDQGYYETYVDYYYCDCGATK